jgi:hypothetical protein
VNDLITESPYYRFLRHTTKLKYSKASTNNVDNSVLNGAWSAPTTVANFVLHKQNEISITVQLVPSYWSQYGSVPG